MVKPHAEVQAGDGLWLCGLSMADFEVPSEPTPVAQAAQIVTAVTMDLADAFAGTAESQHADAPDEQLDVEVLDLNQAAAMAWSADDEQQDYANRKVVWPYLDSDSFKPASSVRERIEDNIAAIRLMKALAKERRPAAPEEMEQMLRYSGWGGAARVFGPDGSTPPPLADLRNALRAECTEKAFAAIQASVNTAFYTPPELVKVLWRLVEHLGFKGGRVIEPAAGIGHVIAGMPHVIAKKSTLTAVELDPTSASILEACFAPYGLQAHASALEDAKQLPLGFYDLAIGNVPFGDFRTNDTSKAPYSDWLIHNWFLAKSIELVRPGGLVAMITSKGSLDSVTDTHRRWLAAHAELVAAFRLPTMAFDAHANTEAVTDIVVFKRRDLPDFTSKPHWVDVKSAEEILFAAGEPSRMTGYSRQTGRSYTQTAQVNKHFVLHPDAVVGRLKWKSSQHGPVALPVFDGDMPALAQRLEALVDQLPQGVYAPAKVEQAPVQSPMLRYTNLDATIPGAFVVSNRRICVSEGAELLDVDSLYTGTARKRLLGMMEIRNAAVAVIEHQAKSDDDAELQRLQRHLNQTYDGFVAQLGALSTTANSRIMRSDPNWPLLLALEIYDEETETVTKADIFSKRTVGTPEVPSTVDSVKDALLLSLSLYGKIDLQDMARRVGKPVREVIDQLSAEGLAYRDPALSRWVPADEYLSGHIGEKIAQAKAAGPAYEVNIPALEAVLPPDLGPAEVEARLGAPWIPCDVVKQFATELVNDTRDQIDVSYDKSTATWSVKSSAYNLEYTGERVLQVVKWGTDARCALTLVEAALNQQPPTITRKVDDRTIVDATATFAAREKWQAIRDEFRMWVYRDDSRRDRLLRIYNDAFNQIRPRVWDGSHMHLPGISHEVTPYPAQKNAIWRIVVGGNVGLFHCVGAGKTLMMVAGSMELRRLGKARKPLHVVQNACLSQYTAEAVRLYPQAKVLMATKEDLAGDKRRAFVARIATGDWDAVIMTQSTFERLMLSPETQQDFIDSLLAEARTMMSLTEDRGAKRSIKELEKRMKEYEAKLARLAEGKADELNAVWFEELGVDYLFIDEAHAYKNLMRLSKMPRIAGLPNVASQRAFDVFMKTRLVMQARGGREEGVVMATATPLSNSLAEMHVNQLYLQPQTLKRLGLYEFDAWSASFGEAVTGIELAPDGSGFRTNTRYSKFVNVPELMAIFKGVADIQTKAMLNLPTPPMEGGKPQVVSAKPSEALQEIVAKLVKRADAIRNRSVSPDQDNMLAVTNDGRRAALDVRLIDPSLPFDPQGKLALAAENIYRIWKDGDRQLHTQLVFSDLGTPGAAGFSVYAEVRRLLLELGIPADQIAFIQDHDSDAAKAKLFKKVRAGTVRVLLGSTQKMGTGTNVQKRLRAVHQLDCPWTPAAVEQRDGRADRQGNECDSIALLRYVTEQSFDAYSWNLICVKGGFIEQVLTAGKGLRTVEDISITAMSYAELKAVASGNPLVMEKAAVDAKVQKLSYAYDQYEQDRWRLSHRKASLEQRLSWINSSIGAVEADARLAAATSAAVTLKPLSALCERAAQVAGSTAGAIGTAFKALAGARFFGEFAEVNGFKLSVERGFTAIDIVVIAPNSGLRALVERPNMNDVVGVGEAALATIAGISRDPAKLREEFGRKTEELQSVEKMLGEEFEHRDALVKARARQAEIEALLDLDKATTGCQAMDAESA